MIKVKKVDHVGIVVGELAKPISLYNLLGLQVSKIADLPHRGLKIAFLPAGESQVELLVPTGDNSYSEFLETKGEGIHHICLEVEDIDAAVKELTEAGVQMLDRVPRPALGGRKVAFLHPDAAHGVVVELLG